MPSPVHGIGLFTQENITKGQVIYTPSPQFDLQISKEDFLQIDDLSRKHIMHYGFRDSHNIWHLAFDNIRFCNHSKKPNIGKNLYVESYEIIALCNIKNGQELLQNFSDFENPLRKELFRKSIPS